MSDEQQIDSNEQMAIRRQKLEQLREEGRAYPNGFQRDTLSSDILAKCAGLDKETIAQLDMTVTIAGRIMTRRNMGKASFINIQDVNGRVQVYVKGDLLKEGVYDDFKRWDIGDIIGVTGQVFMTNKGEVSVRGKALTLLTKSLRPLPDKWHGLADQEVKYRQRYVDLIVNEQSRKTFIMRSQVVEAIRQFMIERSFLEVETPMMHVIPGGAAAKPFETHHNALDIPLYLRIAPELYLKRLVVGGFEKVFEVNRNFRNEGLSTRHNPEFTMLEFYWAYADYNDLMDMTEAMLRTVADQVLGGQTFQSGGIDYDFSQPFTRMTILESIMYFNPEYKLQDLQDRDSAIKIAESLGLHIKDSYGLGKVQIEIFEETVEEKLIQPTFITAYPVEVSPLSRRNDDDHFITDRFEFFVAGREVANGFSELNDPDDQKARFLDQVAALEEGDDEAMHYDADYITALEYGMPPTAGEGIGIDRLVMLLSDSPTIKDVILFPHMRPQG
ncbi:MAG: lysine--tRNA ligase [Gammaproteobacteria bacterium]|nr:MAG: lysine--tRNA ligase [Gammaproteobacteria bacterium]